MMVKLFLSLLMSLSIGLLVMRIFLPLQRTSFEHVVLKASLAVGLGFGITSCTFFLSLLAAGTGLNSIIYEAGILALLVFIFFRYGKNRISFENYIEHETTLEDFKLKRMLSTGFYLVLASASINIMYIAMLVPNGTWDAWAIWNMHARFIFRGGEYWRDAFSILLAPKHHPDYPLLLPLTVARGWTFIGKESLVFPMTISLLFTFSMVGLMYSALSLLKSKSQAHVACLFLLSTPVFLFYGASQQADIPIAFFFLASLVFLFLQGRSPENYGLSFLSGVMAGFAGWTKNEGLLFLIAFIIARVMAVFFSQNLKMQMKQLIYFVSGSVPVLAMILYFKINLAPPNDLISGGSGVSEIMSKLEDCSRYVEILKGFIAGILFILPQVFFLLFYPVYVGVRGTEIRKTDNITSLLVLFFMLMGYFCVYLITPYDLAWHLKYSLSRLLLQLWPTFILIYFMIVQTPDEFLLLNRQLEMLQEEI